MAYVRPHDTEISRESAGPLSVPAVIVQINAAGPVVRVTMARRDTAETVRAELSQDEHRRLGLRKGESVYATPRKARVFGADYEI